MYTVVTQELCPMLKPKTVPTDIRMYWSMNALLVTYILRVHSRGLAKAMDNGVGNHLYVVCDHVFFTMMYRLCFIRCADDFNMCVQI